MVSDLESRQTLEYVCPNNAGATFIIYIELRSNVTFVFNQIIYRLLGLQVSCFYFPKLFISRNSQTSFSLYLGSRMRTTSDHTKWCPCMMCHDKLIVRKQWCSAQAETEAECKFADSQLRIRKQFISGGLSSRKSHTGYKKDNRLTITVRCIRFRKGNTEFGFGKRTLISIWLEFNNYDLEIRKGRRGLWIATMSRTS